MDIKPLPKLDALLTQAPRPIPRDDDESEQERERNDLLKLRRTTQNGLAPAPQTRQAASVGDAMRIGAEVWAKIIGYIFGNRTAGETAQQLKMDEQEQQRLKDDGIHDKRMNDLLRIANPGGDKIARAANDAIERMHRHAETTGQVDWLELSTRAARQAQDATRRMHAMAATAELHGVRVPAAEPTPAPVRRGPRP